MSVRRLRARVPSAVRIGTAILDGYRLAFHKTSLDGSAKCDVIETAAPGACVHGVLYTLAGSDLRLLDMAEGCGYGYSRKAIELNVGAGARILAECYFATDVAAGLRPYGWYLEHVLIGARQAELPEWYIDQVASVDCVDDPDERRHARELSIYPLE